MKILFNLITKDNIVIDPNYQSFLSGAFYSALSKLPEYEKYHDSTNIHSISQLYGTKRTGRVGVFIPERIIKWGISSPDYNLILNVASNLVKNKQLFEGVTIFNFEIKQFEPQSTTQRFVIQSPILIKKTIDGEKHYFCVEVSNIKETKVLGNNKKFYVHYDNEKCSELMTSKINEKLKIIGIPIDETLKISFDTTYKNKKVNNVVSKYDKKSKQYIKSFVSVCPIIVEGKTETIKLVYDLGIGDLTGAGFGFLY